MRIALIRQRYASSGGPERQIGPLIARLLREGHVVHLFANRAEIPEEFRGRLVHRRVPVVPGASFLRVLSFARFASTMVRDGGFALVHSFERSLRQDLYRAGDGCHREWLRLRHRAAPWRRLVDSANPLHRSLLFLDQRIFAGEGCRRVSVNSRMVKEEIVRHYGTADSAISVVYNGVDLERFHPGNRDRLGPRTRHLMGLDPEHLVLLLVGSGFERKGLRALILGAAEALARRPTMPLVLVVAGKGDPRPYQALAARSGMQGRLHVVGMWGNVEQLYAAADVLVLPTLYDPFANAVLEAMAAGLPVITTRANGASELLVEGGSGFVLRESRDPGELGGRILAVLDRDRRVAMGGEARRMAERFPMSRQVQETMALYRELLEERRNCRAD